MSGNRNYKLDKEYTKFRSVVRKRDKYTCKWPGCCEKKKLQVHHIFRWANYPHLRYSVDHALLLCKNHHSLVTKSEEHYAALLLKIIQNGKT